MKIFPTKNKGIIILPVVVFSAISILFVVGLVEWAGLNIKASRIFAERENAFQVAEAGIEYYKWHLVNSPDDFTDGTGLPGPYVHQYKNKNDDVIGSYSLEIIPPLSGGNIVTIRSTGTSASNPTVSRAIELKLAKNTLAKYAMISNADLFFDVGTEVFGQIYSNGGIHFDGIAHNLVMSAKDVYKDPDHSGNDEFGVHTHVDPIDPPPGAPVPVRQDVFLAGREFPVPAIDFAGITFDLASLKSQAQSSGVYLSNSGAQGYHIVLKTDDTFDLFKVNTLTPVPNGCTTDLGESWWGTWSINSGGEQLLGNYAFPANNIIFVEDNTWVDGQINTAKITIASARFPDNPSHRTSITVNRNLLYTNYDGLDSIALVAQGNFNVGLESEDILRIDAAVVAQNGRVGRYYYKPPTYNQDRCSPYDTRQSITLYGLIATNEGYEFSFDDGTGYGSKNIIYDANLVYSTPPGFPLPSEKYSVVSWKEI